MDQEIKPIKYRNAIQCTVCDDVIESKHRHDFKWCSCGSCAVDGGNDLFRWDPDLLLKLLKRCAGTDGAGSSEIKSYGGRPVDPVTAALMRGIVK